MTDPTPPAASGDAEALPTRDVVVSDEPLLHAVAGTHHGKTREANQDTFLCEASGEFGLYAAIDGVGGYAGGHIAAGLARDRIRAHVGRLSSAPEELLREAVLNANNAIVERSEADPALAQMACVLTVALVDPQQQRMYAAHVGDTRLYHRQGDTITKLTPDHSFVGLREDAGQISEEEAMRHPRRNEILRDVGSERRTASDPDFVFTTEAAFQEGDALLLCSDGLTDLVPKAAITRALIDYRGSPKHAVNALVHAALEAGGTDNVTAVVVEYSASGDRVAASARVRSTDTMEFPPDTFGPAAAARGTDLPKAPPSAVPSPPPAPKRVPMWVKGAIGGLLVLLLLGVSYIAFNRYIGGEDDTVPPEAVDGVPDGTMPADDQTTTDEAPALLSLADQVEASPTPTVGLTPGAFYRGGTVNVGRSLEIDGRGATWTLAPGARYAFDVAAGVESVVVRNLTIAVQDSVAFAAVMNLMAPEARIVFDGVRIGIKGSSLANAVVIGRAATGSGELNLTINPDTPDVLQDAVPFGAPPPSGPPSSAPASGGSAPPPVRGPAPRQ